jgi:hypothetical protein
MGTSQGKPEQEEMQMQEISREEVRAFYDGFPEDEIRRMRGRVAEFCRRALDAEPSVKEVADAFFEMGRRLLENAAAQIEEEADEESPAWGDADRDVRALRAYSNLRTCGHS